MVRTTLMLDDDLAGLLKRRARELGISFEEAVNRTIRAGIGEATATGRHPAPKTISHSFGFRPGIDRDKLGQVADVLNRLGVPKDRMITVMIGPDKWLTRARHESRRLVIAGGLGDDDIGRMIKQAQREVEPSLG